MTEEKEELGHNFSDFLSGDLDSLMEDDISIEEATMPEEPILTEGIKDRIANPSIIQDMIAEIDKVDHYAWNRGSMGLDFGFESLNKSFRGFNPGLHLVAGGANTGKSALLLNILWKVALNNQFQNEDHPKKAFCLYFSLDDTNNELMPRIVAMDQRIEINQVLFPKSLNEPEVIRKREEGLNKLKANVHYFAMKDSSSGNTIEYIEDTILKYKEEIEMMAPNTYQLAVFIDNFHDITVAKDGYSEDNARFDYIAGKLTDIANAESIPFMCSAEFKKISEHKRPEQESIKSSGKITYESKGTILVYNEVGAKNDNANVYWELTDSRNPDVVRKMPVLEMHIAKNKFTSFKGRHFLRFIPEMATFIEADEDEAQRYRQMMRG